MDYTGKVITKNPVTPTQVSAPGVWTLDEALQAQKGNNWPVPGVYNPISRSLRFNSADSTYLNRTPTVQGNRRTWTFSAWVKRSSLSTTQMIFSVEQTGANFTSLYFQSEDKFSIYTITASTDYSENTLALYRDVSAWYHIVVSLDTTQATAANRCRIYVNNVLQSTTQTYGQIPQNYETWINTTEQHAIGRNEDGPGNYINAYLTEVNFIDGQALTPSDFGLTDPATGVWVPKKYTGTYGTNGFYLNFKDNSNTTTIGYDYSGNGNNWNTNNFSVTAGAGNDSLTDVPTPWVGYSVNGDTGGVVRGNYATLNPLAKASTVALANGNLDFSSSAGNVWVSAVSTMPVSSGKWYAEFTPTVAGQVFCFGIIAASAANTVKFFESALGYGYYSDGSASYKFNNNTNGGSYGAAFGNGDVVGVALDLDAGTLVFYKNGVSQGTAYSSLSGTFVFAGAGFSNGSTPTYVSNFGQRPFAYTPPAGYRSLCTTNLPTPAIGTSSTTLAEDYFNTVLYTGTGSTLGVTGVGFQPDFVWIKSRSAATDHALYDVVRGDKNQLESNTTTAETNETTGLTGFNADGFTVGSLGQVNTNTATYVGWNWKAGGAGVTNTAGSITSTVSANTTAGFSIVTYTGNATSGATVGHGLGVAPSMIIVKERNNANNWSVYNVNVGNNKIMFLDLTNDQGGNTAGPWNNTTPTSTVFTLGNAVETNRNTGTYVAYCFAAIAGYSAFGSYTGNGSTDGPFVYTGFRPRYVMIKRTDNTENWYVRDTARSTYNVVDKVLYPNAAFAEGTEQNTDLLSNGFKARGVDGGFNASGGTYIYAAFAEFPFKFANAR